MNMGRRAIDTEYIEPFKHDEKAEGLQELYDLKLFNVFVINDKWVVGTGSSESFMSKLPQMTDIANKRFKNAIKSKFQMKVISGFRNKQETTDYINQHYSHLNQIIKLLVEPKESHYKIVVQAHPETNKILVVYPNLGRFCKVNNIGPGTLKKFTENEKLIGGYKCAILPEYDYPPTTDNSKWQDPLNLKQPLPIKGTVTNNRNNKKQ